MICIFSFSNVFSSSSKFSVSSSSSYNSGLRMNPEIIMATIIIWKRIFKIFAKALLNCHSGHIIFCLYCLFILFTDFKVHVVSTHLVSEFVDLCSAVEIFTSVEQILLVACPARSIVLNIMKSFSS